MFSNLLQTPRGILNRLICVVHFSNNFNSVFRKNFHENCWCCSSIACQEKGTDWILRIFTFNDKNRQIGYLEYSLLMIKIDYVSP